MTSNKPHNVKVHVQKVERIDSKRVKVKIAETAVGLSTLTYEGRTYETSRSLGRGRYIMKEVG
jgi:hypothetical protein